MTDWQALIDEQVELHTQLLEAGYYLEPTEPGPPATAEQILVAETRLGVRLDAEYRSFLLVANGWREQQDFWNLLGTEELGVGSFFVGAGLPDTHRKQGVRPWDGLIEVRNASWGIGMATEQMPAGLTDWRFLIPIGVTEGLGGQLDMVGTPLDTDRDEAGPIFDVMYQPPERYESFSQYLQLSIQRDRENLARL